MTADGADAIRRRDEILQVLYWMRGEGLGMAVGPEQLRVFLGDAAQLLADDLAALTAAGLLEPADEGHFRLSELGVKEGGRRFDDAFSDYIHAGHGACSDPNCDCHQLGPEACAHAGEHSHSE